LPFSFEAFEFNKKYLLFFLVSFTLFVWLAKMIFIDREIRFKKTALDIFVLVFLLVAVLSAIFSVDKVSSLLGFYGRFSDGLIGLLSLGIFYFLLTNNIRLDTDRYADKYELTINGILKVFSWSVFFVILFSYFSIFGWWAKLNAVIPGIFSRVMSQPIFNPVAGSMEGLTIFLAAITVLFVGLILEFKPQVPNPRLKNIFYSLLILASLGILIIIDYSLAWAVLLVSLAVFLFSALITRTFRGSVNRLLLPVFLIIIALAFLSFNLTKIEIPKEQILGGGTSWQTDQVISWQTSFSSATENIKAGFLGSGIGTYFYDFAKFKPASFNQDPLWYIGFDRSSSHFAETLGTMGFLGLISYLVLIGVFLIISWVLFRSKTSRFQLPLLITFFALAVGQLIYYQNTSLAFTFWLMLGLGAVSWQSSAGKTVKEKIISFKEVPETSLMFSAALIVLGVIILGLYYFGISYYLADVNYQGGLALLGQERIEKLGRAVELNPRSPRYRMILSRAFLFDFLQEAQKPLEEQDLGKMQDLLNRAINEAKTATDLGPNSSSGWNNRGIIYREIVGLVGGAAEESIKSFERSVLLEPTNPVFYTELGKLHLSLEDGQRAKDYFQKAQEKKPDYAEAIIQEALILEKEDVLQEAITKLENLIARDLWNIEAHFQLGRLYYNVGRIDEAIGLFETVALLVPQHSNALYSLGVAYTTKDRVQEAILVFERVLEMNPGNQDVIQKLETLKDQTEPVEEGESGEESEEELVPIIEP
jgi:tetratricopeptide (TPR) repeat protein